LKSISTDNLSTKNESSNKEKKTIKLTDSYDNSTNSNNFNTSSRLLPILLISTMEQIQ
jgi:hypothetical protein